jgi:predicted dehydrogenase
MQQARIAVVGAGTVGREHARRAQASDTVRLAALVDPSPAAVALAAQLGVPHHGDLDALLAADRPDGIVLATPNALHAPQALRCIEAGLPVLVEKPIAPTLAEAEAIAEAAGRHGVPVLVGHHRAHSPLLEEARRVVDSGRLGRIVAISGSATFAKPAAYFAEGAWRREPGGGPILINLIHEVHALRLLAGEIVAVQALVSDAVRGHAVEDTAVIGLRFAGGALGSFVLSDCAASQRSWEQTAGENPAYARSDDDDCYVVTGTRGSLAVPTMRLAAFGDGVEPSWNTPPQRVVLAAPHADPLQRQMEHFGAVVRGEEAPRVSARDGAANLRVVLAIAEAAELGGTVRLD